MRPLEGRGEIAGLLEEPDQLPERRRIRFCQPQPLLQDPRLEVAREKLAPVQARCVCEPLPLLGRSTGARGRLQGGFELRHIGRDGGRIELHRMPVREEDRPGWHAGRLQQVP